MLLPRPVPCAPGKRIPAVCPHSPPPPPQAIATTNTGHTAFAFSPPPQSPRSRSPPTFSVSGEAHKVLPSSKKSPSRRPATTTPRTNLFPSGCQLWTSTKEIGSNCRALCNQAAVADAMQNERRKILLYVHTLILYVFLPF